jgi:hypothetical protein
LATVSFETVDNPVDKCLQFALQSSLQFNPWPFRRDSSGFAMDLFDGNAGGVDARETCEKGFAWRWKLYVIQVLRANRRTRRGGWA